MEKITILTKKRVRGYESRAIAGGCFGLTPGGDDPLHRVLGKAGAVAPLGGGGGRSPRRRRRPLARRPLRLLPAAAAVLGRGPAVGGLDVGEEAVRGGDVPGLSSERAGKEGGKAAQSRWSSLETLNP